jgi:hypothetical protein
MDDRGAGAGQPLRLTGGRGETALSAAFQVKDFGAWPKFPYDRPGHLVVAGNISNLLDYGIASKYLILRPFQKSGSEFTHFRNICKEKYLGGGR